MLPLFMQRNNFTESDCPPRARYFPLIPTRLVLLGTKISSALSLGVSVSFKYTNKQTDQTAFPVWSVCLFVCLKGTETPRERETQELSRPVYTSYFGGRCIAIYIAYGCVRMYIYIRAFYAHVYARVSADYVATLLFHVVSRNEVSPRDVTQNMKNEICFDEHLRVSNDPYTYVHTSISIPVMLYQRSLSHTARRE